MRENYRKSIASMKKFPQFTTMNVIDGQAGLIICASLIFYSLTIDNILNIIVLLILAGVAISMLSGENGILSNATKAAVATEIAGIEEEANLIYLDIISKKYTGATDDISMSEIISELKEKGYTIETVAGNTITGITLESNSLSISAGGTGTIKVNYEGSSDGNAYYAVIKGEYYQITLGNTGITVARTPSEINGSGSGETLTATVTTGSNVTIGEISGDEIPLTAGSTAGTSTITVTYGEYTATCTVAVVITPTDSSVANSETTLFSTNYGRIDVIWLDETTNNVTTTPNEPVLSTKNDSNEEEAMTPVTWTYDSTTKTWNEDPTYNSGEWYNYKAGNGTEENTESHWANAKTANGSYFVWIPRYAYRITYYESETSTTPTGYYDGYGMWSAIDGSLKYELDEGIETVDYNGNKYIVHPAFMDDTNKKDSDGNSLEDYARGGWSSDLSGFWFAKYEMSGSGSTTSSSSTLKSEPGVASLRSTSIGNQYRYSRTANYGYTGKTETLTSNGISYTYTSYMNSHLVKNSEWGAVAYLTQSQYGRNGHEISVNQCYSCITGAGRGLKAEEDETGTATGTSDINNSKYSSSAITDAQKYNGSIGVLSSTTGNVYGVYDMSGGAWEYAASYDELGSSTFVAGSSYGLYMTQESMDSTGNYINTKYITTYSNGTTSNSGNNIIYGLGKIGDSTKEVNKGGAYSGTSTSYYDNWFSDYSIVVYSSGPFFGRGGCYNYGSVAGVFYSYGDFGYGSSDFSFRVVLCL